MIEDYTKIQAEVQLEIKNALEEYAGKNQINVSKIPDHGHTGVDSRQIQASDVEGSLSFKALTGHSGTLSSAGDLVITTGFKPKLINITAMYDSGATHSFSIGSASTITDSQCMVYGTGTLTYSFSLIIQMGGPNTATVSAIDSTSFTLTFNNAATGGLIFWEAIG